MTTSCDTSQSGTTALFRPSPINYNSEVSNQLMYSGFAPCSDLATHQILWIPRGDQINGSSWGISAVNIAAQYAKVHADEVIQPNLE